VTPMEEELLYQRVELMKHWRLCEKADVRVLDMRCMKRSERLVNPQHC